MYVILYVSFVELPILNISFTFIYLDFPSDVLKIRDLNIVKVLKIQLGVD